MFFGYKYANYVYNNTTIPLKTSGTSGLCLRNARHCRVPDMTYKDTLKISETAVWFSQSRVSAPIFRIPYWLFRGKGVPRLFTGRGAFN